MSFGRILVQYIYSVLHHFGMNGQNVCSMTVQVQELLDAVKVKIDIDSPPQNGTWNIKGVHTLRLMHHFGEISEILNIPETNVLVSDVLRCFQVMFALDVDDPAIKDEVHWFQQNVTRVIDNFETMFLDVERNYTHQIKHHAARLIANGGIGIYSNDIIETMNYLCKQMFLRLSNRGGSRGIDWMQMSMERHFMARHVQLMSNDAQDVIRLASDQKKMKQFIRELYKK